MIALERVSTATKSELQSFFKSSPQMARELGVLTKEVINTTAEISKLGYSLKESEYLTRLGLIGKTVGDLDNASDAVDYLTATLKGFRLETEQGSAVLDFMNHTANTTSINFAAIGEGFKRMSASMAEGNNTIEESMGMLVAGYDVIRNSEQVATALRTTSMRLRGVSEEGEDLTYLVPKLEAKFNKFGLSLKKDNDTFKSTFEILKDVSTLDISDIERAGILEDIAGKRNAQAIAAIIQNMQTAIDVSESFAESQGSALIEHRKYMEGVEAAHSRVAASMTELHEKLLDDDTIISILNLTSALIDNITAIGKWNFAILGTTGALLFFISATKKMIIANEAMKIMNIGNAFKAILINLIPATSAMFGMKNAMDATTASATMLNVATGGILLAIGALTIGIGYLINTQKRQREEMEKSIELFQQQKEISKTMDGLISSYEELASKTSKTAEEEQKLLDVKQKIKELLPESTSLIDDETTSIENQAEALRKLTQAELESSKTEAMSNLVKYEKKYDKATKAIESNEKALKRLNERMSKLIQKQLEGSLTIAEEAEVKSLIIQINRAKKELENNKEIVELVDGAYEILNMTLDDTADKIDKQNEKYKESTFLITQVKEETDKYFDSLNDLSQAYNTLNQGQSLSAKQILDLTEKYPELMSQIKLKEGYLYLEKDAIMAVMKAEETAFKEDVKIWEQTAINVRESLLLKLSAYGQEVKSINDVISARKKLADTYDEVNQFKMVGAVQDVSIKLGKFDIAAKELEDIEARIASLGAIGKADLVGGAIKSSKSTKSATEETLKYVETIDAEIRAIKLRNVELLKYSEILNEELDEAKHIKGIEGMNKQHEITGKIIQNNIALMQSYKDLQEALHQRANQIREEYSKYDIDSWFDINAEQTIEYLEQYKKASQDQRDEMDLVFNRVQKLKKAWMEFNEEIKNITKTNKDLQYTSIELLEKIESEIQSLIDDLEKLKDELVDLDLTGKIAELNKQLDTAKFNHWIETLILGLDRLNDKSELLSFKLSLFDEEDYENRANVIADLYQASQEKLQGYREEWDKLSKITPKNANEAQQLANAMKQVQQGMRDAFVATRNYHRQLEKLQVDAISNEFEKANKQLELQLSIIDHNIKQLQDGILPDFTLDMVIPIPDFSEIFDETKSENERIYNEQVALEEQILTLKKQSLAMQLQEAEDFYREEMNKLMQHYTELIAKIAEKEREIANLREFLNEQQKEQLKAIQKVIKLQIEEFDKSKEKAEKEHGKVIEDEKLEHYNRLLRDLGLEWLNPEYEAIDTHQLAVEYITNSHLLALQSSYSTAWSNIVSTVSSAVSDILSMVAQANAAVASMGSGGGGGGAISVGTKTVKVNPDGKAPKGLSVGTVVETAGGDYKITKVKSDGSYESIKLYADGTEGHPGGKALVGEKGKEIAILPSGRAIILGKYGGELVDLPCGTHVVPHEETKEILKHTGDIDNKKIFKYEDGTIPKYAGGILGGLLGVGSTISKVVSNVVSSVGDAIKDTVEKTTKTVEKEIDYSYRNEKWEIPEGVGMMSTRDLHDYVTYKLDADREFKETGVWNKKYSEGAQALRDKYGITEDEYSYGDLRHVRANIIFGDFLHYGLTSDNPENVKKAIKIGAINDYWDMPDDDYGTIEPYSRKKRPERGIGGGFDFGGFAPSYETPKLPPTLNELIGIDKPDFLVEMSKEFKEGTGKYSEGLFELLGFEGYDKYLEERKDTLEEIAKLQSDYLKGTDDQISKEEILAKIDAQLLEDTRTQSWLKVDLLEQMKNNVGIYIDELKTKYDELIESGNAELAKQVFEEYNNMLSKQMQIENQISQAIKQRYDMEFALIDKKNQLLQKQMQDIEYAKSLKETLSPDDVEGLNALHNKTLGLLHKQTVELYDQLKTLKDQQNLLEVASYEWNIIDNRIISIVDNIRKANLEIAKMAKSIFSGYVKEFRDEIAGGLPGEGTGGSSKEKDDFIDGLEKELEIRKIMLFVEENQLSLNKEQLEILQAQGKIRKSSLDLIMKELELQELLMRMENLRGETNIQQLQKKEDGTWDWDYIADQKQLNDIEKQIIDKQLDIIRTKKAMEEESKAKDSAGSSTSSKNEEFLNNLDEVLNNAENRVYKTAEEFKRVLEDLGIDPDKVNKMVKEYWDYFLKTAQIFIDNALELTKTILNNQIKEFERIGNEVGASYTQGIIDKMDKILSGEGDIVQKHKAIIDMLADEFVNFAFAGNKVGTAFVEGLINSMGTEDYILPAQAIPDKILEILESKATEFRDAGNILAANLYDGLILSIKEQIETNQDDLTGINDIIIGLLSEFDKFENLGTALGEEFMQGLIDVIVALSEGVSGEGENALSDALNEMIETLDEKIADFAEKGDIQGMAYAEALKLKLIEALNNADITQEQIIEMLNDIQSFDIAGFASGSAYGEGLTDGLLDADKAIDTNTSQIISGLEEDITRFGDVGTKQGDAYAEAIKTAFAKATQYAKDLVGDLIDYANSGKFEVKVGVGDDTFSGIQTFDSGGYTGRFSGGKLGILHEKELILDKFDTSNLLESIKGANSLMKLTRNMFADIKIPTIPTIQPATAGVGGNQIFHIAKLEFPNVRDSREIQDAIRNLSTNVTQWANRK